MPKFFIRILQPKVPNPKIYTRNLIVRTFINTMGFSLRFQVAGAFLKANGKRYSYLEIQYGGQNVISFVLSCHSSKICQKDSPHQNVFKLTLSQKSYAFRKDRQHKYFFFFEPKFRPDKHLCTGSRSSESSRRNLAEKLAYFAGCRLLSTTLYHSSKH